MIYVENYTPEMQVNNATNSVGLATIKPVDMSASSSVKLPAGTTINGSTVTALGTITSASATAFSVGLNGTTNPAFNIDSSTASQAAGLNVKGAATGGTVAITTIDSGAATNLSIDAKGTGNITIGGVSTGILSEGRTCAGVVVGGVVNTTIATQNATPTAANLLGGLITHTSTTGAGTFQLPTGTQMSTAISGNVAGDSFWVDYANVGNQTVTITAGVGFTITGTAAVPTLRNAQLFCVCTSVNNWIANLTLSA